MTTVLGPGGWQLMLVWRLGLGMLGQIGVNYQGLLVGYHYLGFIRLIGQLSSQLLVDLLVSEPVSSNQMVIYIYTLVGLLGQIVNYKYFGVIRDNNHFLLLGDISAVPVGIYIYIYIFIGSIYIVYYYEIIFGIINFPSRKTVGSIYHASNF